METSLPIDKYKKIRMAQAEGARTVEDLRRMTDLVIETILMEIDQRKYLSKTKKKQQKCKEY